MGKGMTEKGERISPDPDTLPCDEYDPAGDGVGLEPDGHPQCALCGWPRSKHRQRARKGKG